MKISKLQKIEFGEEGFYEEYKKIDKGDSFSIYKVQINGSYPNEGFAINLDSNCYYFIKRGEGEVVLEEETFEFKEGDVFLIKAKQKYQFIAKEKTCLWLVGSRFLNSNTHIKVGEIEEMKTN